MADSEEEWIRKRAYTLWEEEGYPSGKDREHWEQAKLEYATRGPTASFEPPEAAGASRKRTAAAKAPKAVKSSKTDAPKAAAKTVAPKASAPKKAAASKATTAKTAEKAPAAIPAAVEPAQKRSTKVPAGK